MAVSFESKGRKLNMFLKKKKKVVSRIWGISRESRLKEKEKRRANAKLCTGLSPAEKIVEVILAVFSSKEIATLFCDGLPLATDI